MTPSLRNFVARCLACLLPTLWLAPIGVQAQVAKVAPVAQVALPAGITQVTEVEGIREYRLDNGLQVLLVPDDSKPTTTVNVTYRVGSRHENYGETGMAHLLEHLIFKGTPTTRNALAEFTRRGLRANGTTSWDRTNYFASFAANDDNLRWYLSWQADVMVNSFIAKADLDTEMTVVRNEMEMGENSPGNVLFQRTLSAMYEWHNYGKSTIGARSDVENVDIARLQAFYRQHYQPDNATLIVAGRFDPAQVLAWVKQSFGPLPRPTRKLMDSYTLEPAQDGERSVTVKRVGGAPTLYMAYHLPAASHPDFAAATLLAQALGDAPSGRLHKRLVEQRLAAQVFGTTIGNAEASTLFFGASLAPGQDLAAARRAMTSALDGLASQPLTAAELQRARTQWLNAWEQGFVDPETVGVALSAAIAKGDWRLYFLERNRVRAVTLADLQAVTQRWLLPDNRTVGQYVPTEQPRRAPAPKPVDVPAQLAGFAGDAAASAVETFEATPAELDRRTKRFTLASGMQVALLPKGTRGQAVQVRLVLRFGDEKSLFGQGAAVALMGALINKGGAGLTRQQISDAFDELRADVGISAGAQTLSVSYSTTQRHLPATIELLARLLRNPSFPTDALEEARTQWLAGVQEQSKDPGALLGNALERHGNPYPRGDLRHALTFDELQAAIKTVRVPQLQALHSRLVSAAHGQFVAVGAMDPAAVQQALERGFGDWARPAAAAAVTRVGSAAPSASPPSAASAALPPSPGRKAPSTSSPRGPASPLAGAYVRVPRPWLAVPPARLVIQTPDKQNAHLQVTLALPINDSHPDYAALMLADHLFGGGGNSRLWQRIREREGLSYDVGSNVSWGAHDLHSTWSASAIFAPQNQPKVEAAWREELARSLSEGFTQSELDAGRQGLLNLRRLARAQDAAVAAQLVNHLDLGRRFQVSQETDDQLARLSLAEVNAVWRRYIDPARLVVGWGGDFKAP